uniref:NADP-dependent oxidoreductase domain-containing protein n=1 Tax=Melopsittacus undulatus TaxID=13146 RepID=A0A8C6J347_MELUD
SECECSILRKGQSAQSLQGTARDAVKFAIDVGYCHFDCAYLYQNESEIRNAAREEIKEGVVRLEEQLPSFVLPLQLWSTFHERSLVKEACQTALAALQMDYLDLYLMHWPMGFKVLRLLNHGSSYHPVHILLKAIGLPFAYPGSNSCALLTSCFSLFPLPPG